MDPRHRQILEALNGLRDDGRTPAAPVDVALRLGLRDPAQMGGLFAETQALGWVAPANKSFAGDPVDFEITPDGESELRAAQRRPEPPVTLDDIEPQVRTVLERHQIDQPLYPSALREQLRIEGLTNEDTERLMRQMAVRGMVEPYMDGWYPV